MLLSSIINNISTSIENHNKKMLECIIMKYPDEIVEMIDDDYLWSIMSHHNIKTFE